jgi:dTDP-4-amino-4,6-dideoxygalactose transaminase
MYKYLPSAQAANLPQANAAADTVLCLPIYSELTMPDVARITDLLRKA